jgi:uncharacterized protein YdeI (YjbR/CyaY-like superfamily)
MTKNNSGSVDWYFDASKPWYQEKLKLRAIALQSGLTEVAKWGKPTYQLEGNNIFLIHTFKNYAAILFIKGALMPDPKKLLIQQTPDVQAARQLRFTSVEEITKLEGVIKAYIQDAIVVEQKGLKIEYKKPMQKEVPLELINILESNPKLNDAFVALSPGRQNGYIFYFKSAKKSETRIARIEKHIPDILRGKGLIKGGGVEE